MPSLHSARKWIVAPSILVWAVDVLRHLPFFTFGRVCFKFLQAVAKTASQSSSEKPSGVSFLDTPHGLCESQETTSHLKNADHVQGQGASR
jgi:hypothetical protein